MLIISLYYGMTRTVLSLSYVWLIWFSTFSESPFYRWRIDRTVKQIAWGHTAVRARILNSIWLTVCPFHPWMAWAGWERWHLSGQCLLPGRPPSIVLRAGVFAVDGFGNYCFHSGLWACVRGWVWVKPKLVSEELVRTPLYLLHLGGCAIITWLLAGQVLGQGNQVLHRLCCCDCALSGQLPKLTLHVTQLKESLRLLPCPHRMTYWRGLDHYPSMVGSIKLNV